MANALEETMESFVFISNRSAGPVTNLTVDLSETAGGYYLAPDTESGPIGFLPKLAGNGWKNGATGSPTEHVPLRSPSSHAGRLLVDVSHDPREISKDYANHFRFLVKSQLPFDRTVELMSKFMAQPATVRNAATRQFSEWTMSEVLVPKVDGRRTSVCPGKYWV